MTTLANPAGPDNSAPGAVRRFLDGLYLLSGYLAGCFLLAIFLMMLAMSAGRELGINVKSGDDIASWCMAAMTHPAPVLGPFRAKMLCRRATGDLCAVSGQP